MGGQSKINMAKVNLFPAVIIFFVFQNLSTVVGDNTASEGDVVNKLLDKLEWFQRKIDRLEKSEKEMKASVSALIGTNVQFRLQIQELTARIAHLEKTNADKIDRILNLEQELGNYKREMDGDCKKFTKECDDETHDYTNTGGLDTATETDRAKLQTTKGNVKKGIQQASSQVAFTAYLDHPVKTLGRDQPIVYNIALLNEGSAYSINTGIFRVPVSGIYLFSWASTARKLGGEPSYDIWIHLVVNGISQVGSVAESRADADDNQGCNSAVIRVTAGDEVWTSHSNGYPYIYGADNERSTSFMGILIYPEE